MSIRQKSLQCLHEPLGLIFTHAPVYFCQRSMVRLLIRLACLSNELMAIKLPKSLTFESNGKLCSSTSVHRRDRTAQSTVAPDGSPAFSRPYCIQVTLTAPLIPPKACARAVCNKDNYIKQPFEIPSGLGWRRFRGFWETLMHCFACCNGRGDVRVQSWTLLRVPLNNGVPRLRSA